MNFTTTLLKPSGHRHQSVRSRRSVRQPGSPTAGLGFDCPRNGKSFLWQSSVRHGAENPASQTTEDANLVDEYGTGRVQEQHGLGVKGTEAGKERKGQQRRQHVATAAAVAAFRLATREGRESVSHAGQHDPQEREKEGDEKVHASKASLDRRHKHIAGMVIADDPADLNTPTSAQPTAASTDVSLTLTWVGPNERTAPRFMGSRPDPSAGMTEEGI